MYEFIEVKSENQYKRVEELARCIWKEHYDGILSAEQIDYMLLRFQSAGAVKSQREGEGLRYFIVRSDGAELGYFALKEIGERMYLSKLYVLSWARRKGVGRNCMEYIKQLCRLSKKSSLYLNVNRDNTDSIAAYKAFGFKVEGQEVTQLGDGFVADDYIMSMDV